MSDEEYIQMIMDLLRNRLRSAGKSVPESVLRAGAEQICKDCPTKPIPVTDPKKVAELDAILLERLNK